MAIILTPTKTLMKITSFTCEKSRNTAQCGLIFKKYTCSKMKFKFEQNESGKCGVKKPTIFHFGRDWVY